VLTPAQVTDLPVLLRGDGQLQLMEELARDTRWGRFVVYRGFLTDLASVPGFMRWLVPASGRRVNLAAILHDFACRDLWKRYREGRTLDQRAPDGPLTGPRDTDVLFREMLRFLGLPVLLAWIAWLGVRLGAAANPARRPGIWRDVPRMTLVAVGTGWFVLPAGIIVLLALCAYMIAEALASLVLGLRRKRNE
jgi:hypothetical protein